MQNSNVIKALEKKGYKVSAFPTGNDAVLYLRETLKGKTIGFGGSHTLTKLHLQEILSENNTVYVPDYPQAGETFYSTALNATHTDIFLLSANAVSEDGNIINIDQVGNRLAGSLFGHEKVIYIIGQNKIGGTLEEAVNRARNTAAPKNAIGLRCKTPCAMAVMQKLEATFREKYQVTGTIDSLAWQQFIEELDESQLNTHCYDCKSPDRICGSLLIHLTKPTSMDAEVIIIGEKIGF